MTFDTDSPFMQELRKEAEMPLDELMSVNGSPMGRAIWNLICSKRDLSLWTNLGMKPHRHWKVTDVKRYFGIKGTGEKLMGNFMELFDAVMPEGDDDE